MDKSELLDCIDWVALGYEIVQSIFPGWKFAASDTIAANALHGALLVGKRHAIASHKNAWLHELASFRVELYCGEKLRQTGGGALVLDSPLRAAPPCRTSCRRAIRTIHRWARVKSFRPER